MAKQNKEFEWRMQGMLFAHKIVKEKGLDELTKEIKMRNLLKLDIWARKEDVDRLHEELSANIYTNMLSTMLFTLHDIFGFGRSRLHKLKDEFSKNVEKTLDLDYACQEFQDEKDGHYKKVDIERVLHELRSNDFADAEELLERRIG